LSKKAGARAGQKKSSVHKKSSTPAKRSGKQDARGRRAAPKLQPSQNVPQFAPNFSVYVLPPDTVCLYSEDRKFFLHGEVYCALATAIGKGGKSFPQLADELSKSYPPDQIEQSLKRLMERGYIVPASPSSAAVVDGYWASLGLPPGVAAQNLENCRVRIEAIDVKGAAEFSAALSELGVRIANRSPDLTVTLVNDYLERQLESAAGVGPRALADRAALRCLSAGRTGVHAG